MMLPPTVVSPWQVAMIFSNSVGRSANCMMSGLKRVPRVPYFRTSTP
jgi:hypothetical protein